MVRIIWKLLLAVVSMSSSGNIYFDNKIQTLSCVFRNDEFGDLQGVRRIFSKILTFMRSTRHFDGIRCGSI